MENSNLPTTYKAEVNIFDGASGLQLSKEESTNLTASFDEKLIEIRPDGLIFLPQVFWRQRLNQVVGIGQWALIVKGSHKDPDTSKDKLYVEGVLLIRGHYVATAVGEAELHSDNKNQSWASVWESAKSDCITRCCKDLSIASEMWQPQFTKEWQKKYAIEVWCKMKDGKSKKLWRKKTSEPFWNENKNENSSDNNNDTPVYPAQNTQTPQPQNGDGGKSKNHTLTGQGQKPWLNPGTKEWNNAFAKIHTGQVVMDDILVHYRISKANAENILNPKFIYDGSTTTNSAVKHTQPA